MPLPKRKSINAKKGRSAPPPAGALIQQNNEEREHSPLLVIDQKKPARTDWELARVKRKLKGKKASTMPSLTLKPMLASLAEEAFNNAEWQFEIKWDGYRALAYVGNGKADLRSRNNLSFLEKYPSVVEALHNWPVNAVVDGEIVVLTEEGKADFGALQQYETGNGSELLYFVFDILWLEGVDLQNEPLTDRRELLREIIPEGGPIRFSESIDECGVDFYKAAKDNGLEGIVAKRKNSLYSAGERTKDWLKIKAESRHEVIICGYTRKRGTDRLFSSLIMGIPEIGKLTFIGQVGTGFTRGLQAAILKKLRTLSTRDCPFNDKPSISGAFVQWVRPKLLAEVKYTERTKDGRLRHPSFQGLRYDKTASAINVEAPVTNLLQEKSKTRIGGGENTSLVTVEGQDLRLTNLTKKYWPKERINKGDLLNYYQQMAPMILSYLQNRPQSLHRFPNGINGESFYQKDLKGKTEGWLKTFSRSSDENGETKEFLVCTGEASLLYMVNLGCIELNPWHSTIQNPHCPDWCVIDLDPGNISFDKVIETARVVHRVLESLDIPSFPKTSGSTGLHIYIPLGARYSYDQSRQLAELIATLVHAELPSITSLLRNPLKRKDKIYLDFLQNRPIQTICAPYSVRPKPGATVSAPLHWEEVRKGLKMSQFTLKSMGQRVKREGDLFKGVLRTGIDLQEVLQSLSGLLNGA